MISLLYDKTFHMTQVQEQGSNQQATQQDIEYLRRQQQEMAWRQQSFTNAPQQPDHE